MGIAIIHGIQEYCEINVGFVYICIIRNVFTLCVKEMKRPLKKLVDVEVFSVKTYGLDHP